jgi:ribonuclease Z
LGSAKCVSTLSPAPVTGSSTVIPRAVLHAQPYQECFGYRLETGGVSFVYSGDAGQCRAMEDLARGYDILVHMCHSISGTAPSARIEKHTMGHKELARFGGSSHVRDLVLSHVTERIDVPGVSAAEVVAGRLPPGVRERLIREMATIQTGNLFFREDLMEIQTNHPAAAKLE